MLIEALTFSKSNYFKFIKKSSKYFVIFFMLTITFDFVKLSLGQGSSSAEVIVGILEVLSTYLFYALLIKSSFNLIDNEQEEVSVKSLGVNFFIYLRVNVVYSLLFLLGIFLFVLPGIWAMIFLFFAPMITLDNSYKKGKFFKRSIELVKANLWITVALSVMSFIIMGLDFALFPYIKESSFKLSGMMIKGFIIILLDFFFLLTSSKIYKEITK